MFGRIAEWQGDVAGFTVWCCIKARGRSRPSAISRICSSTPGARGHGLGRALIEDLLILARDRGWSRLYWHTRRSNEAARRLYDKFVEADDFVRYRMILD